MRDETWVIVDTETSGLNYPIYAVEIAAQRMKGWQPDGAPFSMLLNHDVPIEPDAQALHGYSREYLRQHGKQPLLVHEAFHEYARTAPIVAYNLSFDFDRVLVRETQRLKTPQTGTRGFCALCLARRLITETPNLRLDTLKQHFSIDDHVSHRAANDVATLARLMRKVYRGRLECAGIVGFDAVTKFTEHTPLKDCRDAVETGSQLPAEWYIQTREGKPAGPFTSWHLAAMAGGQNWLVAKQGMDRWMHLSEVPEIALPVPRPWENNEPKKCKCVKAVPPEEKAPPKTKKAPPAYSQNILEIKTQVFELYGLCKGIMADGVLDDREILLLQQWITACPCTHISPISKLADTVERVLADGVVTPEEREELTEAIEECLAARPD